MAKTNLFSKAKKTAKKSIAKKDDKIIVTVKGKEFAEKLKKFANLKAQMDELKTEMAMTQEYVKSVGIDEYVKLVETSKVNSGSFILTSETEGRVMILPTKKYIKINEETAEVLTETYGEDIVSETTKYGFNTDVLTRNMDAISEALLKSDALSDEDKEKLIEATTTYAVKKDTLDKVYTLSKESGNSVKEVIEDIQPVIQMKNPKA